MAVALAHHVALREGCEIFHAHERATAPQDIERGMVERRGDYPDIRWEFARQPVHGVCVIAGIELTKIKNTKDLIRLDVPRGQAVSSLLTSDSGLYRLGAATRSCFDVRIAYSDWH